MRAGGDSARALAVGGGPAEVNSDKQQAPSIAVAVASGRGELVLETSLIANTSIVTQARRGSDAHR